MRLILKRTILVWIAIVTIFISCDNYLDVDVKEGVNPSNFYSTEGQIDQAIVGLYNTLSVIPKHRWFLSEVRSDNVWMEQSVVSGASEIAYFLNADLVTNGQVQTAWKEYFSIIANANAILDKIDDVTFKNEDIQMEYKAEVKFLRALAYFDLVRFFGNIPIATGSITPLESLQLKQSTAEEVYEQVVIPDLSYASEYLMETFTRYDGSTDKSVGRPVQMAAKALLAEVYITMSGFPLMDTSKKSKAQTLLKEVIDYSDANGKWWAADIEEWNKMWIHENDNKYYLFEIQADIDASTSQGSTITPYTVDRSWNGSYYGGNTSMTSGQSYGYPFVEPRLRNYFAQKDNSGSFIDKRCSNTITVKNRKGQTLEGNECYFMKFWETKVKREACGYEDMTGILLNKTSTWPQNFPVIRLENYILYYAELLGLSKTGVEYLNRTRIRAGLPAYKVSDFTDEEEYQQAVLNERRYELAEEGHRWFDLVRLNKWETVLKDMFLTDGDDLIITNSLLKGYAANVLPFTYLYPIPQQQMQVQVGLYVQNQGY